MPTYRIEVSATNRAVCRNTECKNDGVKIQKGELRFGNLVEIRDNQSWHWKHWGCTTPMQLDKWWNEVAERNLDYVDGYDELPDDLKAKVKRALEQGHVDDDDWGGDIEKNRPGEKGYRTPKKKKKAVQEDDDEGEDDIKTPSKAPPKKRGRPQVKNEDEDEDEDDGEVPPPKKSRGRPKKAKIEEPDPIPENSGSPAKKRGRPKKAKEEAPADDSKPAAPTKGRGRPRKDAGAAAPKAPAPAKTGKGRGRPKKAV